MASVNWTYNNSKKMALHPKFARGEVVWAKLTGYPWWPGAVNADLIQIVEVEEDQEDGLASTCIVKFFGEDSQYFFILQPLVAYYLLQNSPSMPNVILSTLKNPVVIKN